MMEENVEHPQRFNDFHFFEELFELISSYGSWVIYCGMFPSHRLETDFFPPCLKRFFHLLIIFCLVRFPNSSRGTNMHHA